MEWYELLGVALAIWLVVSVVIALMVARVAGLNRQAERNAGSRSY